MKAPKIKKPVVITEEQQKVIDLQKIIHDYLKDNLEVVVNVEDSWIRVKVVLGEDVISESGEMLPTPHISYGRII